MHTKKSNLKSIQINQSEQKFKILKDMKFIQTEHY